jgi:hypothetical protein
MELDRAEEIVREILAPQYLSPPQELVFRAAWNGQSYQDLAADLGYEHNYIKGVGAQIWKMLATATECRVSKGNFRQVLESVAEQLNFSLVTDLAPTQSQIDWGEAMDVSAFYGRELERDRLYRWTIADRCRIVAILGMGGMGKTTIAIELVQQLQAISRGSDLVSSDRVEVADPDRQFTQILWRSAINAPLLTELLADLIRTAIGSIGWRSIQPELLTRQAIASEGKLAAEVMPKTVAGQIELLLKICQKYRCLIVLDNVESIFQAGA